MNTDKIQFELVSPERRLIDETAAMVVVPGGDGDFGATPMHSPLVSTIRPGVVRIYKDNMETVSDEIFIAGGFADVTAERCTVLAEEAMPVSQLDADAASKELETLKSDMDSAATDLEKARFERKIAVVQAKLDAVSKAA